MDSRRIGLLGAGQLGRMFVEAASRLNVEVHLLEVGQDAPAKQISSSSFHVDGAFNDSTKIRQLAKHADILTVEIEHVNTDALQAVLDEGLIKEVHPTPSTIKLIQDKYDQKKFLEEGGIPVADFIVVGPVGQLGESSIARMSQEEGIYDAAEQFGYPLMIKSRTQAYDGRGNYVVKDESDAKKAVAALGGGTRGLYAERWTPFEKEVAVMVVRSASGEVRGYPTVETYHENSICHSVFAPLRHSDIHVASNAQEIAMQAVSMLEGAGVFGVEMFVLKDGEILVNEIAPRPHNSGHYTIEACETSQYENHVRAILGLPLGSTDMKVASAAMINILGLVDLEDDEDALQKTFASAVASLSVPGASVHLYGKKGCRRGRKMGHITIVGRNDAQVRHRYQIITKALDLARQAATRHAKLPPNLTIKGAIEVHRSSSSTSITPSLAEAETKKKTAADFSHSHPLVGIIMGSDSDLPVMLPAAHLLKEFNVPFELTIVSAHRTPERMTEYARSATSRGLRVIIAGAGGAAHLPGMVAAQTPLPVIGVPVRGSVLDGVDSLHSIVQMPRGVPVATVAINNSTNAALLAIRIIASAETDLMENMQKYMDEMEAEVLGKVERLKLEGWDYIVKK